MEDRSAPPGFTASGTKRAVVAMSGGVDSSVAAALMVERGYDVIGIMLKLWRGPEMNQNSGCCNLGAANDARRVADVLGIPFYVLNFAERFERTVIRDFNAAYARGHTPNPCVRCNQWIKFDALMDRAKALGGDVLVTGHYARIRGSEEGFRLLRGIDRAKDQSYVLWMLTQDHLAHTLLPVGEMNKTETRRIAAELGLRTAAKPDSQEICFVRNGDFTAYAEEHIEGASRPGPIYDSAGREVGRHRGIGRYTVGQRKGLGVSLGMPVFVTRIDAGNDALVVGPREELGVASMTLSEASFIDDAPTDATRVLVQYRAHGDVLAGRIRWSEGRVHVDLDEPAEGVAPGQSAVLYRAERPDDVLGGGIIAVAAPAVAAGAAT